MRKLGLQAEPISTQVVPRDRHAELLSAIALAGAGLERFATEIRHLQRTEVREVEEPFRQGPEGLERDAAQAQPGRLRAHLRASRACCAATPRSALENVALWHERDITHSERRADHPARLDDPARPGAGADAAGRARHDRPRRPDAARTSRSRPARCSPSACCSRSSQSGMQRDDAYRIVQRLGQQAWDTQTPLRTLLEREDVEHRPRRGLRLRLLHRATCRPCWRGWR